MLFQRPLKHRKPLQTGSLCFVFRACFKISRKKDLCHERSILWRSYILATFQKHLYRRVRIDLFVSDSVSQYVEFVAGSVPAEQVR